MHWHTIRWGLLLAVSLAGPAYAQSDAECATRLQAAESLMSTLDKPDADDRWSRATGLIAAARVQRNLGAPEQCQLKADQAIKLLRKIRDR